MAKIKIHALRCGQVRTTKYLPFNPDNKPLMTVAGVGVPQKYWEWLPVYCYYIEHPKGKVLIDTAWSRAVSMDSNCVESLSTHDPNIKPHIVELNI